MSIYEPIPPEPPPAPPGRIVIEGYCSDCRITKNINRYSKISKYLRIINMIKKDFLANLALICMSLSLPLMSGGLLIPHDIVLTTFGTILFFIGFFSFLGSF